MVDRNSKIEIKCVIMTFYLLSSFLYLSGIASFTPYHKIYPLITRQPAKGMFLIATRAINDPIFEKTVIFLVDHSWHGTTGVIINKPTGIRLDQVFPEIPEAKATNRRLYIGGPVERKRVFILIYSEQKPDLALRVIDNVYVSSNKETARRLFKGNTPAKDFRVYTGYAGWAPGQLSDEILRGSWYLADADVDIIFSDSPEEIWHELINKVSDIQMISPITLIS